MSLQCAGHRAHLTFGGLHREAAQTASATHATPRPLHRDVPNWETNHDEH